MTCNSSSVYDVVDDSGSADQAQGSLQRYSCREVLGLDLIDDAARVRRAVTISAAAIRGAVKKVVVQRYTAEGRRAVAAGGEDVEKLFSVTAALGRGELEHRSAPAGRHGTQRRRAVEVSLAVGGEPVSIERSRAIDGRPTKEVNHALVIDFSAQFEQVRRPRSES